MHQMPEQQVEQVAKKPNASKVREDKPEEIIWKREEAHKATAGSSYVVILNEMKTTTKNAGDLNCKPPE